MPTTKKRRYLRAAMVTPLTLALVLATGCATLFNPAIQNIPVATHPDGGEVWVDGKLIGTAPLTLKLDTRKNHDITVRRGDTIRTWQMKPRLSTAGVSYLAADTVVLIPGIYGAVKAFQGVAFYHSLPPGSWDFSAMDMALGIGAILIGVTPLVVDVATNHLNELQPGEITVDFD